MKTWTMRYASVPDLWLEEVEDGVDFCSRNGWRVHFATLVDAIQDAVNRCESWGKIGDVAWAIIDLGPWGIDRADTYAWYIINKDTGKRVKIGPIGANRVNYYERAFNTAVASNAKVHGIKLPYAFPG